MIEQHTTHLMFSINNAQAFWSEYKQAVVVYDCVTDDQICVSGVDAEAALMFCRNALCSGTSVFNNLKDSKSNIKQCKEILKALETYLTNQEESNQ